VNIWSFSNLKITDTLITAMGKVALLALMGILAGAGLPAAAEPALGDVPTKRLAPDHRPALTDAAKAAAVQAGAGRRARSGPDLPAAMVGRSAQVAARADTTPSARVTSPVQARSKPDAPSAMAARAGQAASAANVTPRLIAAARVDPVPHGGPATTNGCQVAARSMPDLPSPLSGLRQRARHICKIWTLRNMARATKPM
jgi:hypothetical protein